MKVYYEVKAYPKGSNGNNGEEYLFGSGKRAKAKAIAKGNDLWHSGKYEAVFVDALNDEEIVDEECVNIPTNQ